MLTWQCGSHPALSQCSIELPHPVFVTSLHRSVDEATLVGVFFLAAGKDVSNLSSRAKSSAWCCRPRQHSVCFFPDGRHRFGCCTYYYAGICRHEEGTCVSFDQSDWTQCSIELRQPVGQSVCLCVYRTATGLVFQALMLTLPGRGHPALSQCSIVAAPGLPALRMTDPSMTQRLSVCLSGRRQKHVESQVSTEKRCIVRVW